MERVFLFAVDDGTARANFGVAVEEVHELERLLPFIQGEVPVDDLRRFYPDGRCFLWGVQDRGDHLATWTAMTQGDLLIGYRNRAIVSASYILAKLNSPSLAEALWGRHAEGPFRLVCFMDHPHLGEVPMVPQMLRYLDPDCRGFVQLPQEKCSNILNDYGSLEIFVRLGLGYDFPFSFRHSE
ncbi:MAG TPA: hypothetical protein PK120_09920 [Syntrophales bacterium]|nr:hypothetical protein [Syntrophales bacterium]